MAPAAEGATSSWRGMSATDSGILYRPSPLFWWRPTLCLERAGAQFRSRRGETTLALSWDDYGTGWRLQFEPLSRAMRAGARVAFPPFRALPPLGTSQTGIWPPSSWTAPPQDELLALALYLAATPAAREGLADMARTSALVRALASEDREQPPPPGRPAHGDTLDMHIAVDRSLDDLGWQRFGGRPVRGEPTPDTAVAAERARLLLSRVVTTRVTDDQLVATVARHLATAPWPFDLLLEPQP